MGKYLVPLLGAALFFAACGDDSNTTSINATAETVSSFEDAGKCEKSIVGKLEYVVAEDSFAYVCAEYGEKYKWFNVSQIEEKSEAFNVCDHSWEGQYALSSREEMLYVCQDEEWKQLIRLDGEDEGNGDKKKSVDRDSSSSGGGVSNSTSSVAYVAPCKSELEDKCEYGELVDERDGQTYKTVVIGSQTWMAENLNYELVKSYRYGFGEGRLYTWAVAVDKTEEECALQHCDLPSGNIRGVCPQGWHVPSRDEWETLFAALGGFSTASSKLISTSGWYLNGNGTDAYAFSALPAGHRGCDGNYHVYGSGAYFWSSSESDGEFDYEAYYVGLYREGDGGSFWYADKRHAFSVRCIKN